MRTNGAARFTLALLDRGSYETPAGQRVSIAAEQAAAVAGTRLYTPDEVATLAPAPAPSDAGFTVLAATTQQAAARLSATGPVCLLNFASARNVGGGFLNGARAQEEDLCRCSGLFRCLETQRAYYEANRAQRSLLYTDHIIYSPRVPFFRLGSRAPLLERPILASVLTAPAPNTGPLLRRQPDAGPAIRAAFLRRWRLLACIAIEQGERSLLLGAWGCGAFQGDPEVAARTAREAIEPLRGHFERVVFAIPDSGKRSARNYRVFRQVLA